MASKITDTLAKGEEDVRQCICSPTTHPGSFRCRLHRAGGTPRSVSCQQFGDLRSLGSPLLCSGRMASKITDTLAKGEEDVRQCICSPTTHPGSFRCRLHRAGGTPRSVSCQQFGDLRSLGSPLLCSGRMPRSVSQQQFTCPSGSGMLRPASEQRLQCSAGLPRSASWQDLVREE